MRPSLDPLPSIRKYYTMAKIRKTKEQTIICKALHRKVNIEQREPHTKPVVIQNGKFLLNIVFLLNDTNII